jgi:hypothetical protein
MAKYSPITRADNWYQGERKRFSWPITDEAGDPVSLVGKELQWRLHRHQGSAFVFITIEPEDFEEPEGEGNNVAVWVVADTTYQDGADTLVIPAGYHYHELWNLTDNTLLSRGGALLQPARRA